MKLYDNSFILIPKRKFCTITRMSKSLYANKETYSRILEWGQNTSDEWYHPISRSQYQSLTTVKEGDTIEFALDDVSSEVQVLEVGKIYEYPLLRHINGEFKINHLLVDRVIRVKRLSNNTP
jgi:hypothetical protein